MPYTNVIARGDTAGIIPMEYSNEFVSGMLEESHVLRKARKLRSMSRYQVTMPVLSALATAYFVTGDSGLKQTTELNWDDVIITAEEIAAIVPIPENVLDDASIDLWAEVRPELITAMGVVIDNAMLHGINIPASWPTAIVTAAVAAGNTIAYPTGADLYTDIMTENGLLTLIEQDGFEVNGHLAHLTMKGLLRGLRDSDGNLIFSQNMQAANQYFLDGQSMDFPTNGCMLATRLLISGDWNQLVYSMRRDMTWKIADEAVITDAAGKVVYNLFQQDMIAMRVTMRLGFQLPNPINRVNQTAATRYPFGVLTA